jgi:hypothetical protein
MHDKDWELALKQAAKQQKAIIAFAKEQRAVSVRSSSSDKTSPTVRVQEGDPHTSICLWRATSRVALSFNPQTFMTGRRTS